MAHHYRLSNAYEVGESVAYALMRLPESQRAAFLMERKWYHYEEALRLTGDTLIAMNWARSVHAHTEAISDVIAASRSLEAWARQLALGRPLPEQQQLPTPIVLQGSAPTLRNKQSKSRPA